jgi:hypothetical protein
VRDILLRNEENYKLIEAQLQLATARAEMAKTAAAADDAI